MAAGKVAALLLLLVVALSGRLASAAGARHGRPGGEGEGGPAGGFSFGMPWFGPPGFFGGGGGGAWGGGGTWYRRGAAVPPSMVCAERGPCRGRRLTCPPRCFKSFSYRGKHGGGGGGGGGGGCSFDCTTRCVATC